MRFIVNLCVVFALCFSAWGCTSSTSKHKSSWYDDNRKVKVLSTISMIDDIVAQVGRERIDHMALISGEIDPHSYELVKGDDEKISTAHLIFYNGLQLEHGASLCCKIKNHPKAVGVADEVKALYPEIILNVDGVDDPHLWMDISSWMHIVDPIVKALSEVDPDGKSFYEQNGSSVKAYMMEVHQRIYSQLQSVDQSKRFLVTSHDAFGYFARSYLSEPFEVLDGSWSKRFAAPEGLAPDGQLSSSDIQKILDHLLAHNINVVFAESNVSQDSLKKIIFASKEKKHMVHFSSTVLYGDAMGSFDEPVSSYLEMIEKNALSLLHEWQKN